VFSGISYGICGGTPDGHVGDCSTPLRDGIVLSPYAFGAMSTSSTASAGINSPFAATSSGSPRRILAIEHESDSGPAMLAEHAQARGFEVTLINAHDGLPATIDGFDGLLIMGAVPSVNDAEIQHWFQPELALIRDADAKAIPIFGVCFGAQALAVALGGSVTRASEPEIGWFTVETTNTHIVPSGPFFEWHVDAITPPADATIVARTSVCVQAYTVRNHLAVQFHPEVTAVQIGDWADSDPETLASLGLSKAGLLNATATEFPAARDRAKALCDQFLTSTAG
jgi:GMP synthase-like glutamine amidotransferase